MNHLTTAGLPCNAVLCRYAEIAIKKGGRSAFERMLVRNIARALREWPDLQVQRIWGRIMVVRPKYIAFTPEMITDISRKLTWVFGVDSFSLGVRTPTAIPEIEEIVDRIVDIGYRELAATHEVVTYRTRARRGEKSFPLSSEEIEIHFADRLLPKYDRLKIHLNDDAMLTVWVEVREQWTFIFADEQLGPGGLPIGSNGRAMVMLSGGIDSPIAAYLTMKRGCRVDFLTFHSFPYTEQESIEKVAKLATVLNRYQKAGRVWACNMLGAQRAVRDGCTERFRTVLYRRIMTRVSGRLAYALYRTALVTGDALGQVASQTLPNMDVINRATDMLILRPLLGMDKRETVAIARRIETYDISKQQCADSCTVFMPDSPATKATVEEIEREEAKLDMDALIEVCLNNVTVINTKTFEEVPFEFRERREGDE
ncbi:MAG TPA: tRNA 4-thiouridine(8) synthase ThiI [Lentisphaeria bacterium]|nr:tRNA 4-thiouridine(8) synthase ThiI [Lentisphaeria bacterium]